MYSGTSLDIKKAYSSSSYQLTRLIPGNGWVHNLSYREAYGNFSKSIDPATCQKNPIEK